MAAEISHRQPRQMRNEKPSAGGASENGESLSRNVENGEASKESWREKLSGISQQSASGENAMAAVRPAKMAKASGESGIKRQRRESNGSMAKIGNISRRNPRRENQLRLKYSRLQMLLSAKKISVVKIPAKCLK